MENTNNIEVNDKIYPRIILGLDISTACIGVCVVKDNGSYKPEILHLSHKTPKISRKIKGIEALFLRKQIFEDEFIKEIAETYDITDVVIEEPLLSSNNVNTVATLLRFNGMISEAIYRITGVVPNFISSYDARMFSFPELVAVRKYNKKGEEYPVKHIDKAINNYNALGTATFIMVYYIGSNYSGFWSSYLNYLKKYTFNAEIREGITELPYPNAATRIAKCILSKDGFDFPVFFLSVKI